MICFDMLGIRMSLNSRIFKLLIFLFQSLRDMSQKNLFKGRTTEVVQATLTSDVAKIIF